jgi:hypothetical protein
LNFGGSIDLQEGEYNLYVLYDPTNTPNNKNSLSELGDPISVEISSAPTATPSLILNSAISFKDNAKVDKTNAAFTASITNRTGFYDRKLVVFIFKPSGGTSVAYFGYQDAYIDQNETLDYVVNTQIDLEPGNYKAAIYHQNTDNEFKIIEPSSYSVVNFTLVEGPTGIKMQNNSELLSIFPNPAKDELRFKSNEKIKSYSIYNLTSELILTEQTDLLNEQKANIEALKSGVYILKIETENGSLVSKFVKQ